MPSEKGGLEDYDQSGPVEGCLSTPHKGGFIMTRYRVDMGPPRKPFYVEAWDLVEGSRLAKNQIKKVWAKMVQFKISRDGPPRAPELADFYRMVEECV
ncbi:unnamed protein product [marine sediment metagenome]|uniref:Uncharacterized protein n=1 Tax=marine sediment metagenome TaxID=412755 RepID=X1CRE5_9ZZZZ